MQKKPVVCAWSGGKDSAWMLQCLRQSTKYYPALLLTTLTEPFERISMHGVRRELLRLQAEALGVPLYEVWIPWPCANAVYEARMAGACDTLKARGFSLVAFGDLFLEEVRAYREEQMRKAGMQALYPLWGEDTRVLARRFIEAGFRARLCCVDNTQIPGHFAGREYDETLLSELPETADPCGENGEFHTFVYDGPIFQTPVPCLNGEVVIRDGRFVYCDLLCHAELVSA